ncbi:MAG: hypothetical protein WC787_04290 [Patescibacteria group bacterium]|jgi:hypothetical protein
MRMIVPVLLLSALFGAGCAPVTSPEIAQPIGEAFPSRPVGQVGGFGTIPGVPTPKLKSGVRGSVRLKAEFPNVPSKVTVLKVNDGRPDETLLRNASNALSIPTGVIGERATGRDLVLTWKDEAGLAWTASANGRRVEFMDEAQPVTALTVSAIPATEEIVRTAQEFLQSHGIKTTRFSNAYVDPDWLAWWEAQKTQGRCMDARSIQAVRALSASMTWEDTTFPPLPTSGCVSPEFPSRIAVKFNATQDGQGIFMDNGQPVLGATILVDAARRAGVSGFFTLGADPLRSDYPGLTAEEAQARLVRGGQGGTPNGDVTIEAIRFEWYFIQDGNTPPTRYLYPAVVGEGTIEYANNTTGPYRIVVPLLKQ